MNNSSGEASDIPTSAVSGISIQGATVAYDQSKPVIKGLDMQVRPGEIVALLGRSGCGKSTLLRAIAGLQPLTGGKLDLFECRRQSDIAYVFQDATLVPWRTVTENVRLPFELGANRSVTSKKTIPDLRRRIDSVLRAVGLPVEAHKKFPRELSGGMRMRVSLARAIATDPSILLLDEPFAALDDMLRSRMNDLVLELNRDRPRTILFVTHNIAEAVYMSQRVVILGGGRISKSIDNDLPLPRSQADRGTQAFAELYGRISAALQEAAS